MTTPQQQANKRQNEKRKGLPQYRLQMTVSEGELLESLADEIGSKKQAIFEGLRLLKKTLAN